MVFDVRISLVWNLFLQSIWHFGKFVLSPKLHYPFLCLSSWPQIFCLRPLGKTLTKDQFPGEIVQYIRNAWMLRCFPLNVHCFSKRCLLIIKKGVGGVYSCLTHTWSSQGQSVVQSSGFSGDEQIAKHTESYDES